MRFVLTFIITVSTAVHITKSNKIGCSDSSHILTGRLLTFEQTAIKLELKNAELEQLVLNLQTEINSSKVKIVQLEEQNVYLNTSLHYLRTETETIHYYQEMTRNDSESAIVTLEEDLESIRRDLEGVKGQQIALGSTYTRWGRPDCPENGTSLVYTGIVGGSHINHAGGASNYLCLTTDPTWNTFTDGFHGMSFLYGTKYEFFSNISNKVFGKDLGDHKVPCAVCRSDRPSAIMIPGRHTCIGGWTKEYSGFLTAGYHSSSASEYICLDNDAVPSNGSIATGSDDNLLYIVEANCGASALKCPPYVEGREITCVVCTNIVCFQKTKWHMFQQCELCILHLNLFFTLAYIELIN